MLKIRNLLVSAGQKYVLVDKNIFKCYSLIENIPQ